MSQGPLFFVMEAEVYRPGSSPQANQGWGARPWGVMPPDVGVLESTDTLLASDLGYRSRAGDLGGVVAYPAVLDTAFEIDRRLALHPSSPAAAAAWGTVRLANVGRRFDSIASTRNSDGRPLRVLAGRKMRDEARGLDLDPPYASLSTLFAGVARPWFLTESTLQIPLADAMAALERPLQQAVYGGTGGRDGSADLKGRRKPRARGGTFAWPIRDVLPVWIDRANGILQVSDAPGTVVRVAEAGDQNQILPVGGGPVAAQVPDVFSATVPSGYWIWSSSSEGLFIRLGSPTSATITADVVGHFPSGAQADTAAEIARLILREDMALPASQVEEASFTAVNAALPWTAGDYWDGSQDMQAVDAVGLFAASLGAKLVPLRDGRIRLWRFRSLPSGTVPLAIYTPATLMDVRPSARLSQSGLYPPPYRWRVGYDRCNTVMTTNLDPDVTGDRQQFLANEYRYADWSSNGISLAYRSPNDPAPVPTRLHNGVHATALVQALADLWSGAPRLYDVTMRLEDGMRHEIGDVLRLIYPLDDLDNGRIGQVVGEQLRSGDTTTTLTVLMT
jgi:hypothetical protein